MFAVSDLVRGVEELSSGRLPGSLEGGAEGVSVTGFGTLERATGGEAAFLAQPKYREVAKASGAGVLVMTKADRDAVFGEGPAGRPLVVTADPYAWFAWALQLMTKRPCGTGGVAPGASVDASAKVAVSAVIEAGATVCAGARIGERTRLFPGSYVGEGARIGDDCILYPNAVVYHGCTVGSRVILHSGCVIGADGFGFAPFRGEWVKIPQVGAVTIGDDVEIGANTAVDRGAIEDTVIGRGTKLDNLIQVGHNCRIGEDSVICANVGIAGSTKVGSHVIIAGAANINGHIEIPDAVSVGPATSLVSWKPGAKVMVGFYPAQEKRSFEMSAVMVTKLSDMRRQLKSLEAEVARLKAALEG